MGRLTEAQSWVWPLSFLVLGLWTVGCVSMGKEAGRQEAIEESERVRYYVNTKIREIGFCKWVEISDIVSDCTGRAALEERGE